MIQVSGLTKRYGPHTAISDLNFQVNAGEIVGFLGPNGAGKSTTMKILTGFMPASEGKATIGGYDVFTQSLEARSIVGYLPETPPVYMEMQVEDYLKFAGRLAKVPKNQLRSSVNLAMEKTGIAQVRSRLIGNLSKGFRQRVGLAQALVHDPKILILDEPTVGLDPKQIIEIRELIKSLRGNHTVILSSHILPEVMATCERIIVINRGKIVAQDSLERIAGHVKSGKTFICEVKKQNASVVESLRRISGVKNASADGNKIILQFAPGKEESRSQVLEEVVKAGMGVLEFSPEKLSLEEVFLELTTQE